MYGDVRGALRKFLAEPSNRLSAGFYSENLLALVLLLIRHIGKVKYQMF